MRDEGVTSLLRPARKTKWRCLLRAVLPLVLLACGGGLLVYGLGHHTAAVFMEQEIEIDLAPPPGMEPPGGAGFGPPAFEPPGWGPPGFGPPGEGFDPAFGGSDVPGFGDPALAGPPPWLAPPPELAKVKQMIVLTEQVAEWVLIREVTFGGVRRSSSGELWRTYTGTPPSLCPT